MFVVVCYIVCNVLKMCVDGSSASVCRIGLRTTSQACSGFLASFSRKRFSRELCRILHENTQFPLICLLLTLRSVSNKYSHSWSDSLDIQLHICLVHRFFRPHVSDSSLISTLQPAKALTCSWLSVGAGCVGIQSAHRWLLSYARR